MAAVLAFTADRAAFTSAATKVARFAPERPPGLSSWIVLKGVMLTASGNSVEVLATDMNDTGRVTVGADVDQAGRVLVDAAILARIARHLPGDTVNVGLDRHWLTVESGGVRYRLLTMPQDDYPSDIPDGRPLDDVKPAGPDSWEHRLSYGERFMRDFRRTWRASRTTKLYAPTGLQPGAQITWHRRTDGGETVEVTGQVWSAAPGTRAVWAIAEGERPVRVQEHTYGTGSWHTGDYRQYKRLGEVETR